MSNSEIFHGRMRGGFEVKRLGVSGQNGRVFQSRTIKCFLVERLGVSREIFGAGQGSLGSGVFSDFTLECFQQGFVFVRDFEAFCGFLKCLVVCPFVKAVFFKKGERDFPLFG